MKDLDLLGPDADATSLTLADAEGRRYRLPITPALRAALRPARGAAGRTPGGAGRNPLSPREIQSMLRAGATVDEVVDRTGADPARIESYATPVEAERAYIASRAQGLRVGHVSDAPNLGDLVVDRLAAREVPAHSITWDSVRRDGHPWEVVVTFDAGGQTHEARWSVDLERHVLTALDGESRWLSETDIGDGRRAPLPGTGIFTRGASAHEDERESLLARLSASRGTRNEAAGPEEMAGLDEDADALAEHADAAADHDPGTDAWDEFPGAHPAASHPHEAPDAAVLSLRDHREREDARLREQRSHHPSAAGTPARDEDHPRFEKAEPEPADVSGASDDSPSTVRRVVDALGAAAADEVAATTGGDPGQDADDAAGPDPADPSGRSVSVTAGDATERIALVRARRGEDAGVEPAASADPADRDTAEDAGGSGQDTLDVAVPVAKPKRKGNRRSVPSWDEIVFGTRSD